METELGAEKEVSGKIGGSVDFDRMIGFRPEQPSES